MLALALLLLLQLLLIVGDAERREGELVGMVGEEVGGA